MMKHQQQHLLLTLCALVAFLSCSMVVNANAATTDKTPSEKRQHLRSLLLRGAANRPDEEKSQGDHQDRDLKSLSMSEYTTEYSSTLDLYQMNTSMSPNTAAKAAVQPYDEIKSNGATGQLFYKESGWEFTYALTGRGLPPDTAYELVLMIPKENDDSSSVTMTCLGSGMTTLFGGGLFIRGSVPVESSMVEPTSSNQAGARVWLALGSEVDCTGAQAKMVQQETPPSYAMYLFPKSDKYIEFQYLGDHGQQV